VEEIFRLARPRIKRGSTGFTLVELMVVVAVVAIVAALAYPSYQAHVRKGHRAAAEAFLIDIANRQQQYLLDARRYAVGADALTTLSLTVPPDVVPFYAITVEPTAPTVPPTYRLVATPVAGSMQVPDGALALDHVGLKTRDGQPGW
jgi:type IV pilus assembly protein PilE